MENQTRFDLNAAIENWRNELAAQPNFASDNRRELETHLRDAIAELRQRGLNEEESFWLARRRVGQPQRLAEEFVKANSAAVWRERVFWMIAAILAAFLLYSISTSLAPQQA
ncbi:MAG: permease prefix domain 1-containing protein [Verrucomicrobiia bacterium]